jgi:hypothetical protein
MKLSREDRSMTRRTRRPAPYVAAHPDDVLHSPRLEGQNVETPAEPGTAAKNEPPAGKPALTTRAAERKPKVGVGADRPARTPAEPGRERTLHELNLEARAIDREHARIRAEAAAKAKDVLEPMLAGVPRVRTLVRRMQKSLRPPVLE